MIRFKYIARGMLAGLLGAWVAAVLAFTTFLVVAAVVAAPDAARYTWGDLSSVPFFTSYSLPLWASVGLVAGIGMGWLMGPRPVRLREVIVAAIAGAVVVMVGDLPATAVFGLPMPFTAIPAGIVGGAFAAVTYGRLAKRIPATAADASVAARTSPARWPVRALVLLLLGVAVPMLLAWPETMFGAVALYVLLPLTITIGWLLDLMNVLRAPVGVTPWAERRRIGLAMLGGLLVVALLTGLSAAFPTEVAGRYVRPPVWTDSGGLRSNGWPAWWRVNVGQTRGWEYRPAAHGHNAALWAGLVLVTVLIEPVAGVMAAELRRERRR